MRTQEPDTRILSRDDCMRLLRSVPFGRLVYTIAALPAVQPVNFIVHGDKVIIRTRSESKLHTATRNSVVAFQVDDIDIQTRAGWSVTVVGRSYEVMDPQERAELAREGPEAWGQPDSERHIAIQIDQITGRWLHSPAVTIR